MRELTDRLSDAERRASELVAVRFELERANERERELLGELEAAIRARERAEATLARAMASPGWRMPAPLAALKRRLSGR